MFDQKLHLNFNSSTTYQDFNDVTADIECSSSESCFDQGTQSLLWQFVISQRTHYTAKVWSYLLVMSAQHECDAHVPTSKHILKTYYSMAPLKPTAAQQWVWWVLLQ